MRTTSRLAVLVAAILLVPTPSRLARQQQEEKPVPAQKPVQAPSSQEPINPANPEDVVRITTQLVQIDAVVTDKKGEHVDDLNEEDFELTVDGKRQTLTFFKLVKLPEAPKPGTTGPAPKPSKAPIAGTMPAKALAPEEVKRTIAFVVDDLGLSFESTYYARQAIKKFVDEQMQEGDLVGVIRTGRGAGSFQQFTTDKRVLYAAIEKLQWNPFSRDMIPRFSSADDDPAARTGNDDNNNFSRDSRERAEDFRETLFSVGTLGALNFVVRGLRELPGRKTAILISDGFRLFGRDRDNPQVLDQLRRLTDLANRSSVVIYSVDAKGLQVLGPTAADGGGGNLTGPQFAERMQRMSQANFDSQEGLSFLARETGGFAVLNNNDINLGIRRALKDQQSYYLLGFDPEDEKFDQKYHTIKLRTTRRGVEVRTRAGFIGRPETERPEPPRTRDAQILSALFSPFGARDLSMQMTSYFFNSPNPNRKTKNDPETISFVRSLFNIDMSKLTFKDEPDGKKSVRLAIINFTFNENGAIIEQHGREFTIPLEEKMIPIALSKGLNFTDDFVVKKPGAYQFRAVIRDAETAKLGSAGQFIQVPDLSKNRLALSGLVLSAPKEEMSTKLPDDVQPTPTVRRFPRSGSIDYGGLIYNPTPDSQTGKPQLKMSIEIYRDGKPIYQAAPRPIEPGDAAKPKQLEYAGRLKLTALAPGDYLLHVIIEDPLAKKKYSRAEQWMDFSVR